MSSISRREFQEHERSAERHSPSARASRTSRTSRVFLKIPKCFYNSTMLEEQVFFIFFIKCIVRCARSYRWRRLRALYFNSALVWRRRVRHGNITRSDQSQRAHFSEQFIKSFQTHAKRFFRFSKSYISPPSRYRRHRCSLKVSCTLPKRSFSRNLLGKMADRLRKLTKNE